MLLDQSSTVCLNRFAVRICVLFPDEQRKACLDTGQFGRLHQLFAMNMLTCKTKDLAGFQHRQTRSCMFACISFERKSLHLDMRRLGSFDFFPIPFLSPSDADPYYEKLLPAQDCSAAEPLE